MPTCGSACLSESSGRARRTDAPLATASSDRGAPVAGIGAVAGLVLLAGTLLLPATQVRAQDGNTLAIAVGEPSSDTYEVGAALASLLEQAKSVVGGPWQVELWQSLSPSERALVLEEEVQLAVLGADEDPAVKQALRNVKGALGLADGTQLVVRADLDDDLVYEMTRLWFESGDGLRGGALRDLEPAAALRKIKMPVHPGAERFYREHDVASDPPQVTPIALGTVPGEKSFTVYFGFDEAALDPAQIPTVAQACEFASTLPAAQFVLAGHADTVGPTTYNDGLSRARAESVAAAIRNDPRYREALNVIQFGERELAVPTPDEVEEPRNRRVVITVVPAEPE